MLCRFDGGYAVQENISRISNFTASERARYEAEMRNERDQYAIRMTAINEGRAMGIAEGIAIGEARGEAKGLLQAARQMKAKGFNNAVISEMTSLLEDEIEHL